MIVQSKNEILLRIENNGDNFNTDGQLKYVTIDVESLVKGLYTLANPWTTMSHTIEEMSLTGN